MPLGKLTDPEPSFALLGRLKKGAPKPEDGIGKDLDYWRPVFTKNEARERIEGRFLEVYGPQPKEINIRLAFGTVAENWDANLEAYRNGAMVAKCGFTEAKGFYWIFYRDPGSLDVFVRDGMPVGELGREFFSKPVDPNAPVYTSNGKEHFMKPLGRLRVVIPEIALLDPPVVGWFEVQLTSTQDIRTVSAQLKAIEMMAKHAGSPLYGIPMKLSRVETQITKRIGKNLTRGPSWMVNIELQGIWAGKALEAIEQRALPFVEGELIDDVPELESGTPWQGQDEHIPEPEPEPQPAPETGPETKSVEPECTPRFLVDSQIAEDEKLAENLINLLELRGKKAGEALDRIGLYKRWREVHSGLDKKSYSISAMKAIAGEVPPE